MTNSRCDRGDIFSPSSFPGFPSSSGYRLSVTNATTTTTVPLAGGNFMKFPEGILQEIIYFLFGNQRMFWGFFSNVFFVFLDYTFDLVQGSLDPIRMLYFSNSKIPLHQQKMGVCFLR